MKSKKRKVAFLSIFYRVCLLGGFLLFGLYLFTNSFRRLSVLFLANLLLFLGWFIFGGPLISAVDDLDYGDNEEENS